MNYLQEIKPPKNIPIEYLHKTLKSRYQNGREFEKTFTLKKSSLDLSPYTHFENYFFYDFNANILYNKDILTIAFFTGEDYSTDDYTANLFYHKTFNRSDIIDNRLKDLTIEDIDNTFLVDTLNNLTKEDKDYKEDLGFSLDLPIKTTAGWWNTYEDTFEDIFLFIQTNTGYIRVNKDEIEFNFGFRAYESRNKIKIDEVPLEIKKINIEKYFTPDTYSFKDLLNSNNAYEKTKEIEIKKDNYIFAKRINDNEYGLFYNDEDKELTEITFNIMEESDESIKLYELDWEDEKELVYILELKDNPYRVMSLNKEIEFKEKIKTHLERCPFMRTGNQDFILLENGELYMNYKNDYDDEPKLVLMSKNIDNIEYEEDLNSNAILIKSGKYIFFIEESPYYIKREPKYIKYPYSGEGSPFFIEKKVSKKYTKFIYIPFTFEEDKDWFNLDYFKRNKEESKMYYSDFKIIYERDGISFISKKYKRNNPFSSIIEKGNYMIAISNNKKEVSFFIKKDDVFEEKERFYEDEDTFNNIKQYIKLTNLPERITYKKDSYNFEMIFKYSDFKVKIERDSVEVIPE